MVLVGHGDDEADAHEPDGDQHRVGVIDHGRPTTAAAASLPIVFSYTEFPTVNLRATVTAAHGDHSAGVIGPSSGGARIPALADFARLVAIKRLPSSPVVSLDGVWPIVKHEWVQKQCSKRVFILAVPLISTTTLFSTLDKSNNNIKQQLLYDEPIITATLELLCDFEAVIRQDMPKLVVPDDVQVLANIIFNCLPFGTPTRRLCNPRLAPSSDSFRYYARLVERSPKVWIEECVYAQLYDSSVDEEKRDAWTVIGTVYCSCPEISSPSVELTIKLKVDDDQSLMITDDCVQSLIPSEGRLVCTVKRLQQKVRLCQYRVDHVSICALPPLWLLLPLPPTVVGPTLTAQVQSCGPCKPIHAVYRLRRSTKDKCHLMLKLVGPTSRVTVLSLIARIRLPASKIVSIESLEATSGTLAKTSRELTWDLGKNLTNASGMLSGIAIVDKLAEGDGEDPEDGFFRGETSCVTLEFSLSGCLASNAQIIEARPTGQGPLSDIHQKTVLTGKFVVWNENGEKVYV